MFKRFSRWAERGVWTDWHQQVAHDPDWQEVFLDSTMVRAPACAAGQQNSTPVAEARERSRGGCSTKIQALTDALGNPLDCVLTGGQAADITQAEALVPDEPVDAVVADKSYDAEAFVATVSARGAAVHPDDPTSRVTFLTR